MCHEQSKIYSLIAQAALGQRPHLLFGAELGTSSSSWQAPDYSPGPVTCLTRWQFVPHTVWVQEEMWFVIRGFMILLIIARQCTGDGCYDRNTSNWVWLYSRFSSMFIASMSAHVYFKAWSFQDLDFGVWACLLPALMVFHQLLLTFCFLEEFYSLLSFEIVFFFIFFLF